VALLVLDDRLRVHLWSRGAEELFGVRSEDAVGRPGMEALPYSEAGRERAGALRARLLAGDAISGLDFTFELAGGREVHVHGASTPIRGADGGLLGHSVLLLDTAPVRQAEGEREAARAALAESFGRERESAALLDHLYSTAPIGLGYVDRELRFVRVNDALAEINGVPAAEHRGRRVREVLPELADELETLMHGVLGSGEAAHDLEIAGETPAEPGVRRSWLASYYPVTAGAPEPIGLGIVVTEVTERREAERLRRALFDASPMAIVASDLDRNVFAWNRAAEELFGWTAAEVIGGKSPAAADAAFDEAGRAALEALQHEGRVPLDATARRRDGTAIRVAGAAAALRGEAGELAGVVAVLEDVTRRDALERERESFVRLVERSRDFVGLAAMDGTLLFVNEAGLALVGLASVAEARAKRTDDFFHPEDRVWFDVERPAVLEHGHWDGESVLRNFQTGEAIPVETSTFVIADPETGEPFRLATVRRDLRERKRVEEQLERRVRERTIELEQARHEADTASLAKSELVSRVSHELRTPLNAVLGFAQLLQLEAETPGQREAVGHIIAAGGRLLTQIEELLDISRVEAGELAIELEDVPIVASLEQALLLVRNAAAEAGIGLTAELDGPDQALAVRADRHRLEQVLVNLLVNAVKHNRAGGSVTVSCDATSDEVRASVADTGPGIPAELLERLFVPFERLGAGDRGVDGVGLGLALSKRLAEAMGGRIEVESRVGEGSRFSVVLPRVAPGPGAA
jgi:PAS domain S-box-containing protein